LGAPRPEALPFCILGSAMAKKYVIEVDGDQPLEDMAANVMLSLSVLFHEAFPDRWRDAMAELVHAITRQVREADEADEGGAPPAA
jgi:hypothetical protein